MTSFRSLSVALFKGFVRDKVTIFFTIVFPLMFLVIFGSIFQDAGTSKSEILQVGEVEVLDSLKKYDADTYDKLFEVEKTNSVEDAVSLVKDGSADAAIMQDGDKVSIYYSAADQTRSAVVVATLEALVNEFNLQALEAAAPEVQVTTTSSEQVEDDSLTAIQFLTPGLLGWAISISGVFGAAATLVDWRKNKILRRLRLSPVSIPSVIGARVGVSMATSLVQLAIFIGVASLPFFGLRLTQSWWMAIPVLMAGTLTFLALGMVIGAITKTSEGASGLANLVVLPMAFASGSFWPIDQAPQWLQTVSWISPLRYINDALLSVMVRGEGPVSVLPQIGLMLLIAAVLSLIASRMFKWDDL